MAPLSHAIISALKQAKEYWKVEYQVVVQLMANCPLRTESHILDAMSAFENSDEGYQISFFRFGWMNPWWAVTLDENSFPQRLFPEAQTKHSQDLPPSFCPKGAVWIANRMSLLNAGTFYRPKHRYHPMASDAAIDIDDYEDLKMAQTLVATSD